MENLSRNILLLFFWSGISFSFGQQAFYKVYSGSNFDEGLGIAEIPGGGYVVVGSTAASGIGADAYIMQINEFGEHVWTKTYGGDLSDAARRIIHDPSEGYYVFGFSNSFGDNHFDFYVFKTDLDGELEWETTYGTSDWERLWDAVRLNNGDFILVGETSGSNSLFEDIYVVRIDALGNLIWSETIQTPGVDVAYDAVVFNDTTVMIAGESFDGTDQFPVLISMHTDGTVNWTNYYTDEGSGFFRAVDELDGFIYLAGGVVALGEDKLSLHMRRVNENGVQTHSYVNVSFDGDAYFCAIQAAAIDRLNVVMLSDAPNLNVFPYGLDQFFLRYNIFLDWFGVSQVYSGSNDDIAHQLIPTADGGVAFVSSVGDRRNVQSFGSDAAVVKIGQDYEWEQVAQNEGLLQVSKTEMLDWKVYPNPLQNTLYIESPINEHLNYDLFSADGRAVESGIVMNNQIDVSQVPSGVYFLRVYSFEQTGVVRLVKH